MFARPKHQKHAEIDERIKRIHQLMAEKVLTDHALVDTAYEVLEQRYQSGMMRYGSYLLWHGILESSNEPEQFRALLLADDARTASLRRQTIFVGVLTEDEREAAMLI